MVDVEKRYFAKPWMPHNDTKMLKRHVYHAHLPRLKPDGERSIRVKHPLPHQCKRHGSTILPTIARSASSKSSLSMIPLTPSSTNVESIPPPSSITHNVTVNETPQRVILRNTISQTSQESSSVHVTHSVHPKRTTRYNHIHAKIDTGLPRTNSIQRIEPETHQLEPDHPVNWSGLKDEIEHDLYIRTHMKRINFNSNDLYATELTTLGNLIRSKVKLYLSSTGNGNERYKIVVHLTVFPTTAAGLNIASRCLWNTHTDNSITIKMHGVECDILLVVFLCYTDLGGTHT